MTRLAAPLVGAAGAFPEMLLAQSLQKNRSMAEAHHEIAVLLIQKKEFDKAVEEAAKIFSMSWPDDQEPVLLKDLLYFADEFLHSGQPALGISLLERSGGGFKSAASRIAIYKEKGYLYKELNQRDKALDCFREAQRLERGSSR
jgi:tetratricopeptide (TPR) repeat protein